MSNSPSLFQVLFQTICNQKKVQFTKITQILVYYLRTYYFRFSSCSSWKVHMPNRVSSLETLHGVDQGEMERGVE